MIQTKDKIDFSVNEDFTCWCTGGPWYNKMICHNLHGTVFEDFIATTFQDIYELIIIIHITRKGINV